MNLEVPVPSSATASTKRARVDQNAAPVGAPLLFSGAGLIQQQLQQMNMNFAAPLPSTGKSRGALSEEQKRKNRLHAKKSRDRKKNFYQSLQLEFHELQEENKRLRSLVKNKIPEKSQAIIRECCYKTHHPEYTNSAANSELVLSDFDLIESLTAGKQSFVLTDPRLPDNPIVYASPAFLELTGYPREQVIGRNCRFLQGQETDMKATAAIREAIASGNDATMCILNYKADGTPFWNQFFVAALRDGERRIINYVGVQCPISAQEAEEIIAQNKKRSEQAHKDAGVTKMEVEQPLFYGKDEVDRDLETSKGLPLPPEVNDPLMTLTTSMEIGTEDDNVDPLDWTLLAEVLEADNASDGGSASSLFDGDASFLGEGSASASSLWDEESKEDDSTSQEEAEIRPAEGSIEQVLSPSRSVVAKTVRSQLIDSLLTSHGDITDARFVVTLEILSSIFKSANSNYSSSSNLHGNWRSLSRPSYGGCLGMNERSDFVYTLGKMSFNMFKPGSLRCSVQQTLNTIEPVCRMDKAPSAAPWSLRRELATESDSSVAQPNTMLKSFDIAVALTIEPGQFNATPDEEIPSPPCRLRALQVVNGYFLPDPETPNRLTVWFTGGKLAPAPPPEDESGHLQSPNHDTYGGFEEWKALFGAAHKRTWGESLTVMGAKLFLGAEVQDGMEEDGSMQYTLHRPHGGHGKAYTDVLYLDEGLLITRGNSGTIHVMMKGGSSQSTPDPIAS